MKKLCLLFSLFFIFTFFTACKNSGEILASADTLDNQVAEEICEIQGYEDLDDEIIKAISVCIRTNIVNNNSYKLTSVEVDEHILSLTKETSGEIIDFQDEILIEDTKSDEYEQWEMDIKKSKLLEFLAKKNISLTNLSNVEPKFDEDKNLLSLSVGGKEILYDELKSTFNLKSQKIVNIKNNLTSITLSGEYDDSQNSFVIEDAKLKVKNGENYRQLLNHFFSSYELKTYEKLS